MKAKYILLSIFLIFTLGLFINFKTYDSQVSISFIGSAIVLTGITVYHLFTEKKYSPFLSAFIVFNYLFFLVAPLVQIDSFEFSIDKFTNYFPYKKDLVIYTNILIIFFNLVFMICYVYLKKRVDLIKVPEVTDQSYKILPLLILVLLGFSAVISVASLSFTLEEIARPSWQEPTSSIMALLLWRKVFFMIPFAGILLCFQYFNTHRKEGLNYLVIISSLIFMIVLLFWFKNPLTEKRNALGPIYISVLFLFAPKLFNSNVKTLYFLFFSMVIVFPLTAILTHTDATFNEIINRPSVLLGQSKGGGIASVFNTLNYDAFSNIMATIDYVGRYGYEYGYQLLSALLFFVPRSMWEQKPITTGQLVGDYLIDDYYFTYNNLSNPLVSEGFINYGLLGVFLMAVLLAVVIMKLLAWFQSEDYLKKMMAFYFAIHLLFLLRGDFANGFSYYIGTLIGVVVIPKIIEFFIKQLMLYVHYEKNRQQ